MESGSAAEALPYLNELAAETNDVQLEILRVEAMKILGLTEYKDLIEELHQKFPENLEVTQEHAAELIKEGRHEEAKKIIQEKFEKIDPEDETALTYVDALIGLDVKNTGEAKTVSTAESIKAKNILNASLEKNPDHTRANLLLGEFYLQKDRFNDAYEVYSSLMAKQTGIDKTLLERIQAGFAIAAANLGKFEQALAAIKQAVDTKPDWVGLRKIFAQIYALAGEIAEAVHEAQIVIHTGSQLIEGIFWFTSFLTSLGKENEAIGVIEKAMAENPEDIFLRCKMAELLFRNNKTEEARSALALVKEKFLALENRRSFLLAQKFSVLSRTKKQH
jgi:tetratricopeptide (TPR) repeat protein